MIFNDTPFDLVCLYDCKIAEDSKASEPDGMVSMEFVNSHGPCDVSFGEQGRMEQSQAIEAGRSTPILNS